MKRFSHAISSPLMSSVWSAVIIGALCFSVGEGLRLTPFPVSTSTQTPETQSSVTYATETTSRSQYGPIDVPAQTQKRSKRQVLKLQGPAAAGTPEIIPEASRFLECDSLDVASNPSVPRPAGRAPPSVS
jgi:hypothetical protein